MTFWIGPVEVAIGDPEFSWDSAPRFDGSRDATIGGRVDWSNAHQLGELVNNPARHVTVGDGTGVLEVFWATDALLRPFRGWYLLSDFSIGAQQPDSLGGEQAMVPFSIEAIYLGDQRQVVVSRSARTRTNDFALPGQALVANPFRGEDPDGEPFVVDPGGTFRTREYDPTSPHDSARLTPTDGSRSLGMHVDGVADLATVALPDLEAATDYDGQSVPRWITDRGGDCRAYDRREGREVFGPSHPLMASTDLVLTNGLVRAQIGARGLPPYLQVQAMRTGEWREVGFLHLSDPEPGGVTLTSARLTRVTPDAVTVNLGLQGQGEATVTLRRGERMLRVQHGSSRTSVAVDRQVQWAGLPPWSRLNTAANGAGHFGDGIDAGRDPATWSDPIEVWSDPGYAWDGTWIGNPDFRLRWPPTARKAAWSMVWWYRPSKDVGDLNGAGLLSIYDTADELVGSLVLDNADSRFKFTLGTDTVQSAVQTFVAGDDIFICLRFSEDDGMALSVLPEGGALAHVLDGSATDPGTTGTYADLFFGASEETWGGGTWGSGTWGGVLWADGVLDNGMIFDDYLTAAEVAALAAATDRMDGLPSPEARLVWHLPGDARARPLRSALGTGRVYEATSQGGSTRNPDAWGLTKALALLDGSAGALDGLSVAGYAEVLEVGAYLATTATGDDLADQHAQFAAASQQEVRVR